MNFDARESERLWSTLGRLNEDMAKVHDLATDTAVRLERFERTFHRDSEMAARRGARRGARGQALLVSAAIALMGAVANYYAVRAQAAEVVHHTQGQRQ